MMPSEPELKQCTDRDELYTALNNELSDLPEKLRIPLVLRYLEGKSQDEVARIVGCEEVSFRSDWLAASRCCESV